MEKKLKPFVSKGTPPPSAGTSAYAYYMDKLLPGERARIIRDCIDAAFDQNKGGFRINWAHMLLASLHAGGWVNHVLTTNFDPLIMEAYSLAGLPIRAFDLTSTGAYLAGVLQSGAIVYLRGQAHAPFLANVGGVAMRPRRCAVCARGSLIPRMIPS